ncbi:hypothetical protein CNMCM6805_006508 [Aspergillus fumigatiaffinis]|uniref:Uncharacterized protein n=1 Tax=Aspergillus fumigatiaffinis TaxID=340414 RepID=A0A8H4HAZ4_9EURO|nr:hypothetical protein CNMCM6457_009180 [Aspergillus fumigatiaffinis]KAF4245075.1 hypothetical protein CNMCM6805_006508 [Aspergillus fumigatiaffinis]
MILHHRRCDLGSSPGTRLASNYSPLNGGIWTRYPPLFASPAVIWVEFGNQIGLELLALEWWHMDAIGLELLALEWWHMDAVRLLNARAHCVLALPIRSRRKPSSNCCNAGVFCFYLAAIVTNAKGILEQIVLISNVTVIDIEFCDQLGLGFLAVVAWWHRDRRFF